MTTLPRLCPCQSNLPFSNCCEPYLNGTASPLTPAALMRSRYCAYALHNADYLIKTWFIATDIERQSLMDSLSDTFENIRWTGLRIVQDYVEKERADAGIVEFFAYYFDINSATRHVLYERSNFLCIEQRWLYVNGIKPRVERNALCPCGSGKKYKLCCS